LRKGDFELAGRYSRILLNAKHVKTIPVSHVIASDAARLRAQHGYTVPDAIQIATANAGGATVFLTNDEKLFGLPEFQVLALKRLLE
jgi:predicted nucleic acid-binding protein